MAVISVLNLQDSDNKLESKVTVPDALDTFLPRAEPSIAALAKQYMEEDGIGIASKTSGLLLKSKTIADQVLVVNSKTNVPFRCPFYATGRKPNVEPLQLENTGY